MTAIERQFNLRVQQAPERKATAEKAKIEASITYSECLVATASQLAVASTEPPSVIFRAANVTCADQRESIAQAATSQGDRVVEAMDYVEKRGEEVVTTAVNAVRAKLSRSLLNPGHPTCKPINTRVKPNWEQRLSTDIVL
jgi:hypothetical protein